MSSFRPPFLRASSSPEYQELSEHHPTDNPESPPTHQVRIPTLNALAPSKSSLPPGFSTPEIGFMRKWLANPDDLQPLSSGNTFVHSWGIPWRTSVMLVLLFILGLGSAVIHHLFYSKLDNEATGDVSHQEWVIRIGTGLAFLSRASLAAVVGISRKQWVWVTLRQKYMTLEGIDAIFGVTTDFTLFKNQDMVSQAKFVTLMALLIWMFPLVAIVTPSTITVVSSDVVQNINCIVQSIKFDFDTNPKVEKMRLNASQSFELAEYFGDHYVQPTMFARKIFTVSAFTDRIATPVNTGPDLLHTSDNKRYIRGQCEGSCSYNLTFLAPQISCTSNNSKHQWASQYFNTSVFNAERQNDTLWIAYVPDQLIKNWTDLQHLSQLPKNISSCQSSIANYTVKLDLQNTTFQEPTIISVTPHESFIDLEDKKYLPNRVLFDTLVLLLNGSVAGVEEVKSTSTQGYTCYTSTYTTTATSTSAETALASATSDALVFHQGTSIDAQSLSNNQMGASVNKKRRAVHDSMAARADALSAVSASDLLSDSVSCYRSTPGYTYESGKQIIQTQVGATSLASSDYEIFSSLNDAIELMTRKMVVSLLADSPGTQGSPSLTQYAVRQYTSCMSTTQHNIYSYKPMRLILAYAIAGLITLCMALFGFVGLARNGIASDTSFSTILRTTRNPKLDEITVGGCLGGEPLPERLRKVRLKFGDIGVKVEKDGESIADGHVAMGVIEDDVMGIDRAKHYS